jgi:sulfur carrier protein ThiS
MQRIIQVTYNPSIPENGIAIQHSRKYYTNTDTLEEAIEQVRVVAEQFVTNINGEIVSISETDLGINIS